MKLETTRFGTVEIQSDDILFFRYGLFGFESQQQWVLLSDLNNPMVAWLQSMVDADIALPVVSPRRFVSGYQVQLDDRQIALLSLAKEEQAAVLAVVSRNGQTLTCNLRAPIVINLDRRVGCQVVTADEQPLQYPLAELPTSVRKSA
jgi:flagellar assembly factor FliW